ncbi:Putative methylpurine-DNA glycosylase [Orpheovirus IHUMI-LCC2]|uniref:Methylpurine-DNA glycosylase n=1 Tax=Orpheovirus IHUMI-LCC2 TaxID=2023057 RepID=A0A2I2L3C2_9VIRU|nr:Putative methylpurine-DNA glycosylase [Orpheovirus IHUMI-LCC2]SNW62026.1 Putative methylpurine-DNA glycosylase [Orpheovirus IHUMI-LCC2]
MNFDQLSDVLLNKSLLVCAGKKYRLLEIEFYYKSKEHNDESIHGHPLQYISGNWYFHRTSATESSGYRGGTYKGLDITFGSDGNPGGILLRAMQSIENGEIIEGPCLLVDRILSDTMSSNIEELVKKIDLRVGILDNLYILREELPYKDIYKAPRIGLRMISPTYTMLEYRYISEPKLKKGKATLISSLYCLGHNIDKIGQLTGSTKKKIEEIIGTFNDGYNNSNIHDYIGKKLENKDIHRCYGCYKKFVGK